MNNYLNKNLMIIKFKDKQCKSKSLSLESGKRTEEVKIHTGWKSAINLSYTSFLAIKLV